MDWKSHTWGASPSKVASFEDMSVQGFIDLLTILSCITLYYPILPEMTLYYPILPYIALYYTEDVGKKLELSHDKW